MDKYTVIKENTRLDTIVLNHYGNLQMFESVLSHNLSIEETIIAIGTEINLPRQTITEVEEVLW